MSKAALQLAIPRKMLPFWSQSRHKVAYGGRGGGKSWTAARMLLIRGGRDKLRILCAREIQRSVAKSVYSILVDQIGALRLGDFYDIRATGIFGQNGTEFAFSGLREHTVDSIRGFEGVDITWIDEADAVSEHSANILVPTVLRRDGAEMWWTFNPDQKSDYVYRRFVEHSDPESVVCPISYQDNPWFPPALDDERIRMQALNDDLYRHIWLGECRSAAGLIFKRRWFRFYGQLPENLSMYMASDYAVTPPDESNPSPDSTEHGMWGLNTSGDLYAADWWSGQTEPKEWIDGAIDLIDRWHPKIWFEELGTIRRSQDGEIKRAIGNRLVWRDGLPSVGGKVERGLGFAIRASRGKVYLPHTEWAERLVNQLCAFTGQDGHVDDMVDVCSLISRGIEKMADPMPIEQPKAPPPPFSERWFDEREHSAGQQQSKRNRVYL